jgi:hypothetical protein
MPKLNIWGFGSPLAPYAPNPTSSLPFARFAFVIINDRKNQILFGSVIRKRRSHQAHQFSFEAGDDIVPVHRIFFEQFLRQSSHAWPH